MYLYTESDDAPAQPFLGFGLALFTLVALGAALAPVIWPEPARPVEVSFCNESAVVLRHLSANNVQFGNLSPGECSSYQQLKRVYARPSFHVSDGIEGRGWVPEDRLGERALPSGRYQFVIEGDSRTLRSRLRDRVVGADSDMASKH